MPNNTIKLEQGRFKKKKKKKTDLNANLKETEVYLKIERIENNFRDLL